MAEDDTLRETCLTEIGSYQPTCEDHDGQWQVVPSEADGEYGLRVYDLRQSLDLGEPQIEAVIPCSKRIVPETFTSDGSMLVARTDDSIELISTNQWQTVRSLTIPTYPVYEPRSVSVNLSKQIVTLNDGRNDLIILNIACGHPLVSLPTEFPHPMHALSSDGNRLYFTGRDSSAAVWELPELNSIFGDLGLGW